MILTGIGGTPGGSTTQLQYNNAGAFGGTSGLTWDGTNLQLAAPSTVGIGVTARSGNAIYISHAAGPALFIKNTTASNTHAPIVFQNSSGVIRALFNAEGMYYTQGWLTISGGFVATADADGVLNSFVSGSSGLPTMLDVISDVAGPTAVLKTASGGYLLQGLDASGNYTFSITATGQVQWGTGASYASMDIGLSRSDANGLQINSTVAGTYRDLTVRNLIGAGGTVTASTPVLNLTQTWNNAGVTFNAALVNVTSTASATASTLLDLQVGSASKFSVSKDGAIKLTGLSDFIITGDGAQMYFQSTSTSRVTFSINSYSIGVSLANDVAYNWASGTAASGAIDLSVWRDAANTLAQRNGTNAQAFRLYRTYTNASNYERLALQTGSDYVELAAETAGTGTDDLDVRLTPVGTGLVNLPGGTLLKTRAALTDGAAAATGTLTNAPAAGNPTKWIPINDNGTTRYIPAW